MQRGNGLACIQRKPVKPSWGTRRRTVENQQVLSINELHRAKAFRGNWVSFPNFGMLLTAISQLRACRHQVEIYVATGNGMQRQAIPITWTHCRIGHRGGWRPWFMCKCRRRAGKLYNAGTVFTCRKCCNLVYECQLKSAKGRLKRIASKIRLQLRWFERRSAVKDKLPPRPYGMRTAKYQRLISRLIAVDAKIAHSEKNRALRRHRYKRG
jgi:hypothetical protein